MDCGKELRVRRVLAPDSTNLDHAAADAANVDYDNRYGLLALTAGEVVGHACFIRTSPDRAEIAFEDLETGGEPDPARFRFEPPEGVRVLVIEPEPR